MTEIELEREDRADVAEALCAGADAVEWVPGGAARGVFGGAEVALPLGGAGRQEVRDVR